MTDRTHFVYEAFDADGLLLYVGCTSKPRDRYRAHMAGDYNARGWFDAFVTHWRVSGPYPKAVAFALERKWIAEHAPIWNAPLNLGSKGHDGALIKQYLSFHGFKFVRSTDRGRPDLVSTRRRPRRLRVVA